MNINVNWTKILDYFKSIEIFNVSSTNSFSRVAIARNLLKIYDKSAKLWIFRRFSVDFEGVSPTTSFDDLLQGKFVELTLI